MFRQALEARYSVAPGLWYFELGSRAWEREPTEEEIKISFVLELSLFSGEEAETSSIGKKASVQLSAPTQFVSSTSRNASLFT
jgi:hypothetical protein